MGPGPDRSRGRAHGLADDREQRDPRDRAVTRSARPHRAGGACDIGRSRDRNRARAGAAHRGADPGGRMTIEIREGDRKSAFDAALNAYGPDSLYVPPLWSDFDRMFDPAKNPFITEGHGRYALFVALRDGRPVGRIAASIHDDSNRKHGTTNGAFGFFDCIDGADVANALLRAAERWLGE